MMRPSSNGLLLAVTALYLGFNFLISVHRDIPRPILLASDKYLLVSVPPNNTGTIVPTIIGSLNGPQFTSPGLKCEESEDTMAKLRKAFPFHNGSDDVEQFPSWQKHFCPDVVDHFIRFPYFTHFLDELPIMTSLYAAQSVCTVYLANQIALSVDAPIYLHAGSHLGAILHGGPIPWDDDVDMYLPYRKKNEFLMQCGRLSQELSFPNLTIKCVEGHNAVKLFISTVDSMNTSRPWQSPFVDIFSFVANNTHMYEVSPVGKLRKQVYSLNDFYPTQPYYFGGISVMGPRDVIPLRRYNPQKCILSSYHHRLEIVSTYKGSKILNCCELAMFFPFRDNQDILYNGHDTKILPDFAGMDDYNVASQTWNISATTRDSWRSLPEISGQNSTDAIVNLNAIETNNCRSTCNAHDQMTVVEFNAERGRHWMSALKILKPLNADVVILNEMDIGMARSDQQHTVSLLASALGMNYAWGMEFTELTRGTKIEQQSTDGFYNFLGLHGNAILSRCKIEDPIIFRDDIGGYFSDEKNAVNANGYEKRLGGRMVMLVRIQNSRNSTIVVGSTHKWRGDGAGVKTYIGTSQAVIAGDQDWGFCDRVGLTHVDNKDHATWPASCETPGNHRGDIICSNMKVAQAEVTVLPCVTEFGNTIHLSDHAITTVSLYNSEDA